MEGCFTFQWGDCIFKWRVHPMGGISFDWGFSKKIIGWGGGGVPPPCPPPLWETLLTIISNVFLLLRSNCKDFRAIHDSDHTERNVRRSKPCWVRKFEEISSFNEEAMQFQCRKPCI